MGNLMNDSGAPSNELERLKIAKKLFKQLIKDDNGYPPEVKLQLKKDLADCYEKITKIKFMKTDLKTKQLVSTNKPSINPSKIDFSHFFSKYQIKFQNGAKGKKGRLVFDDTLIVSLGGVENDICVELYNKLKDDWDDLEPKDIGWVSYKTIEKSVLKWNNTDTAITDSRINTVIGVINTKIKKKLYIEDGYNLIENGFYIDSLWEKHYRFRINTGFINMTD